jgi:hypothetical protein
LIKALQTQSSIPPRQYIKMSSSRIGLRFFQNTRAAFRNAYGPFRRPGAQGRRFQTSDAGAASAQQQSTFQRLWNSPVGIKTVHFW